MCHYALYGTDVCTGAPWRVANVLRYEWNVMFLVILAERIHSFMGACVQLRISPLNTRPFFSELYPISPNASSLMGMISSALFFCDAAYLHHWLSVTIHFNRYNLRFYKYTECRDKCKPLFFIVLHIRVVPLSFSLFAKYPLSDSMCWTIGYFPMYVTERLLNAKVMVFLELLRFASDFCTKICNWFEKM